MKRLLLTGIAALSVLSASAAYAADESDPPLPRQVLKVPVLCGLLCKEVALHLWRS
jgi:hypothetical protein